MNSEYGFCPNVPRLLDASACFTSIVNRRVPTARTRRDLNIESKLKLSMSILSTTQFPVTYTDQQHIFLRD